MEKVLNQEEIDAMVRMARGAGQAVPQAAVQVHVEPWDVRRAGQIGREQLQAMTLLHEAFARNLTHSLGAYLRVVFDVTLVSAEHLTYREFMASVPETTYLASCRLDPTGVNAALQLDLKIAFPIIDLLLGGEGKTMLEPRAITEIEDQILDSVARIICRELGAAWQALELDVRFEEPLGTGEAQRLMPPDEKTLSLSFEVSMPEVRGGLNIAVPATVSNALLRKISADWSPRKPRRTSDSRRRIMQRLLDSSFTAELGARDVQVSLEALAGLAPGKVLRFTRPVSEPASLLIAGSELFHALPARLGQTRAGKILSPVSSPSAGLFEAKDKSR